MGLCVRVRLLCVAADGRFAYMGPLSYLHYNTCINIKYNESVAAADTMQYNVLAMV